MSLHSLLKDTWYMKLKAQREARDMKPSEMAFKKEAIDARADNVINHSHHKMVGSDTIETYKMDDGAYLKKKAGVEHKTSNFTPRFLALLKKSSPASNDYNQAPVEGGDDDVNGSDGGDGGGGGMVQEGEEAGEAPAVEAPEGVDEETVQFIRAITPEFPEELGGKKISVGNPLVYEPVGKIYERENVTMFYEVQNQGTKRVVAGVAISPNSTHTKFEADKMKITFEQLQKVIDKYKDIASPLFVKRMNDDLKMIAGAIKRGDPSFVKPRKSSKKE